MSNVDKNPLNAARVHSGLFGQRYPVAMSVGVKAAMRYGAKVLGQKPVLWRGADGHLNCIEDFRPHAAQRWKTMAGQVLPLNKGVVST